MLLNLTEAYRILDEDMKEEAIEDAMIRAANGNDLTKQQLLDIYIEEGFMGVYNLGLKHMYKYLNGR